MSKEEIQSEIRVLEKRVEWLLQRGSNDEVINSKLRELRNKLSKK